MLKLCYNYILRSYLIAKAGFALHGRHRYIMCCYNNKRRATTKRTYNDDLQRKYDALISYLAGRLTTINTQRNSFRGTEGFAIAVEHLEAKFGEAIITIFVSSLLQMDVSVYLLCFLSTIHYAR